MNVSLLKVRITFQESTVIVDNIGNTKNAWTDAYTCHATVSGESGKEEYAAASTEDHSTIAFTVRYCNYIAGVSSTTHRIIFNGEVYNITGVDHLNYKRKAFKFLCRKERPDEQHPINGR